MIEIKKTKYEDDRYDEISIVDGKKIIQMLFGGNGDLYFNAIDFSLDDSSNIVFNITKENFYLYSVFDKLYSRIQMPLVFTVDECELLFCDSDEEISNLYENKNRINESLKYSARYKKLYNSDTGVISWHDDESIYEEGNILNIYKEDESFVLEFVAGKNKELFDMISVRFRNSGSTYIPFNIVFMDLFKEIQNYDSNYHQIHIEEYLYSEKIKTLRKGDNNG